MTDESDDDREYESGPFCLHWGTPGECATPCTTCDHPCSEHYASGEGCGVAGCDCSAIADAKCEACGHSQRHCRRYTLGLAYC